MLKLFDPETPPTQNIDTGVHPTVGGALHLHVAPLSAVTEQSSAQHSTPPRSRPATPLPLTGNNNHAHQNYRPSTPHLIPPRVTPPIGASRARSLGSAHTSSAGHIWTQFAEVANHYDHELVEGWQRSMDVLLIFVRTLLLGNHLYCLLICYSPPCSALC